MIIIIASMIFHAGYAQEYGFKVIDASPTFPDFGLTINKAKDNSFYAISKGNCNSASDDCIVIISLTNDLDTIFAKSYNTPDREIPPGIRSFLI